MSVPDANGPGGALRAAHGAVAHPWTRRLTRLGYIARGLLYGMMGLLALQVALGGDASSGRTLDQQGAIAALADRPLGGAVLAVMVLGLAAYGAWGYARAILDPLHKGSGLTGVMQRSAYLISGLFYTVLLQPATRLLAGAGEHTTRDVTASSVAWLLARPLGSVLVGSAGAWLMGVAATQLYEAWSARFEKELNRDEMSRHTLRWTTAVGRVGYVARGVVFGLIGFYLLAAAFTAGAVKAKGPDAALQDLAAQPAGSVLLALVGGGLICFGLYSVLCARWAHVDAVSRRQTKRDERASLTASLAWAGGSVMLLVGLLSFARWAGREVAAPGGWLEADLAVYRALNRAADGWHAGILFTALNHPGLDYLAIAALVIGYCARRRPRRLALAATAIGVALTVNMVATWEVQRTPPRERPFVHESSARTPVQSCSGPFLVGTRAVGDAVADCATGETPGHLRGVDWAAIWAQYPTFPSGHMRETVALSVLLGAFWPAARFFAVVFVLLLGYSRVLFGAHYPTDVLGGTILGLWSGAITLVALNAARGLTARLAQVPRVRSSLDYVTRVRRPGRPDLDPLPARLARVAVGLVVAHALLVMVGIAGGNAWAGNVLELLDDTQVWVAARLPIKPASPAPAALCVMAAGLAGAAACRRDGRWGRPTRTSLLALGAAGLAAAELLWLGGALFGRVEQAAAGGPPSPFPDPFPLFAAALVSAVAARAPHLAMLGQALAVSAAATGVLAGIATIHAALAGYLVGVAAGWLAQQIVSQFVPPQDAVDVRGAADAPGTGSSSEPEDFRPARAAA